LRKLKQKAVAVEEHEAQAQQPEGKDAERQVVVDKEAVVPGDKPSRSLNRFEKKQYYLIKKLSPFRDLEYEYSNNKCTGY